MQKKSLLVFIHGITGDHITTWTKDAFYFPEELVKVLPQSDYMSFGYVSNKLFSSPDFDVIINSLQNELIQKVHEYSEIVFIAHSMGGILAKTFFIQNKAIEITEKVTKLILLGTPNNGNSLASLISSFSKNPQFNYLKSITDNNFLGNLTDQWTQWYGKDGNSDYSIQCYCGYENKTVTLVPRSQVISPCCDLIHGLEKGHLSISKPINTDDEVFIWVKNLVLHELTELQKKSKKAIVKYYENTIQILEDKLDRLSNIIQKTDKSKDVFKLLNDYKSLEKEIESKYTSIENLLSFLTQENHTIKKIQIETVLSLLNEGEIDSALMVISDDEIENDIKLIGENIHLVSEKLSLKIFLSQLKNDISQSEKYWKMLLDVNPNDENSISYANFMRSIGKYIDAQKYYDLTLARTENQMTKAICFNNIGTMAIEGLIKFEEGIVSLKKALELYESEYIRTNDELILIKIIETKINLIIFSFKKENMVQTVLNDIDQLYIDLKNVYNAAYEKLLFDLNVLQLMILIESKEVLNLEDRVKKCIESTEEIIKRYDSDISFISRYANRLCDFYFNRASYYGIIFKKIDDENFFREIIKSLESVEKLSKYISKKERELKLVDVYKSYAVVFADREDYKNANNYFSKALDYVNILLEDYPKSIEYKEQKANILIDFASIPSKMSRIDICLQAENILNELHQFNPGHYDMMYARCYFFHGLVNISDKNLSKALEYLDKSYNMAKSHTTEEAKELCHMIYELKNHPFIKLKDD